MSLFINIFIHVTVTIALFIQACPSEESLPTHAIMHLFLKDIASIAIQQNRIYNYYNSNSIFYLFNCVSSYHHIFYFIDIVESKR